MRRARFLIGLALWTAAVGAGCGTFDPTWTAGDVAAAIVGQAETLPVGEAGPGPEFDRAARHCSLRDCHENRGRGR